MEKSIDERARLANPYEKEHYDSPYEINIADKYAEGYKDGATDQDPISRADERKKVIEKACKWLTQHIEEYICKRENYDPMPIVHTIDLRKDFSQAMEE